MKRMIKIAAGFAGTAGSLSAVTLAAVLAASPAAAQKVVIFGDSLSDSGNVNALSFGTAPGSPLGRFSNGLNYVDLLYGKLTGPASAAFAFGLPTAFGGANALAPGNVIDYAVGGALTGTGNYKPALGTSGVTSQIGLYAGLGGTFSPKDTAILQGGGNNFFNIQIPLASIPAGPNQSALQQQLIGVTAFSAYGSQIGNLQALVGPLKAKTVVLLNLPDIGATPAANLPALGGSSAAVQAASLFTTLYNSGLAAGASSVAAANPTANIIQADVAALFKVILANPGAYGFTNTTTTCFTPPAVPGGPSFTGGAGPACTGYLFADSVHPTQAMYAYVAQYIGLLTDPTPTLLQTARLGESGIYANEMITNAVFDRMSGFISGAYVAKNGPYAEVLGAYSTYNSSNGAPGLSQSIGGFRGGIDKKSGATLAGASVSYIDGTQSSGSIKSDIQSWRADVYGTANFGSFYLSGDGGISSLTLNGIKRDTGFPGVLASGSTSGYVATASAEAGYVAQMNGFAIIPSGRVTYYHSQVNAYDESAPILNMSFADRTLDAVALSGKVRLAANVPGIGMAAVGFGEVGYEGFVSSSSSALKSTFVSNTALPTIVNAGDIMSPGILGKVGISTQISANAFVDLQYGIAVHDDGGQTHSGDLRIKATY